MLNLRGHWRGTEAGKLFYRRKRSACRSICVRCFCYWPDQSWSFIQSWSYRKSKLFDFVPATQLGAPVSRSEVEWSSPAPQNSGACQNEVHLRFHTTDAHDRKLII
ncbi:hypothetical protein VTK73DRAFT_5419 [Phialemonium thermophilum]|uniref:Uncharacterized protein n=1 Tax=Phialemonium thermophilum TaxID=223376 RepID=A0ABR3WNX2_9PEZI